MQCMFIPWLGYRLLSVAGCWDDAMMTFGVAWKAVQRLKSRSSSVERSDDESVVLWTSSLWWCSNGLMSSLLPASLLPAPGLESVGVGRSPGVVVGRSAPPERTSASTTTSRSSSASSSSSSRSASPRTLRILNECHLAQSAAPVWGWCCSLVPSNIELFLFVLVLMISDDLRHTQRRLQLQRQVRSVLCDAKSPPTEQQLAERCLSVIGRSRPPVAAAASPQRLRAIRARSQVPFCQRSICLRIRVTSFHQQTNIISVLTSDQLSNCLWLERCERYWRDILILLSAPANLHHGCATLLSELWLNLT